MTTTTAVWSLSLCCNCPACEMLVDLADDPDFWEERTFAPCETGTDRSRGVEVRCPECEYEFKVDLEY